MIYFSSDPHFGHKNICAGSSSWEDKSGCRIYESLIEMNQDIIDYYNSVVKENDEFYVLGDWSFGGPDNVYEFRRQLNCKNIHLIYGNHDHHIEKHEYLQRLFASVSYYKELRIKGIPLIVMSHYAMRVWNESHRGSIMLYGHSHGTLDELTPTIADPTWIGENYFIKNYRTKDVGFDVRKTPYSLDEIVEMMKGRDVLLNVDRH